MPSHFPKGLAHSEGGVDKAARLTARDGRDPKVSLVSGLRKEAGFFFAPPDRSYNLHISS
jgi:hypothetical protein